MDIKITWSFVDLLENYVNQGQAPTQEFRVENTIFRLASYLGTGGFIHYKVIGRNVHQYAVKWHTIFEDMTETQVRVWIDRWRYVNPPPTQTWDPDSTPDTYGTW